MEKCILNPELRKRGIWDFEEMYDELKRRKTEGERRCNVRRNIM